MNENEHSPLWALVEDDDGRMILFAFVAMFGFFLKIYLTS